MINPFQRHLQGHMLFSDGPGIETTLEQKEKEPVAGTSATAQPMDIDAPIRDDGFGGHLGQDIIGKHLACCSSTDHQFQILLPIAQK